MSMQDDAAARAKAFQAGQGKKDANVAIVYLNEHEDAEETTRHIEANKIAPFGADTDMKRPAQPASYCRSPARSVNFS